jgi:sugar lactone lactonase YvrE
MTCLSVSIMETASRKSPRPRAARSVGGVAPLDGGAVATIASGQLTPRFLASDGVNVFWTDTTAGNVLQMNPDGGEPIALASGQANPNGIATDGTNVYFTNQGVSGSSTPFGSVYRVPVGGGSPAAKIADGPSGLGFVTVDATSVYWIAGGSIMKLTPK